MKKTIVVIPMKEKKALEMEKNAKHVSFIKNVRDKSHMSEIDY